MQLEDNNNVFSEAHLLPSLSADERSHLRQVLSKAEEIQKKEEWRKVHLRKAVVSNAQVTSSPNKASCGDVCAACGSSLFRVLRPGRRCSECGEQFCSNCSWTFNENSTSLCGLCMQVIHYQVQSGEWFLSRRQRADRVKKTALEELKEALTQNGHVTDGLPPHSPRSDHKAEHNAMKRLRAENLSPLDHSYTFGGSLPSIVINDDSGSDRSSPANRLFKRRHKTSNYDSDASSHLSLASRDSGGSLRSFTSPVTSEVEDDITLVSGELVFLSDTPETWPGRLQAPVLMSQESITSMYSLMDQNFDLPDNAEQATGDVELGVEYDGKHNHLTVIVCQCRNLLPASTGKKRSSNPFVKLYLLPDKTRVSKRKTGTRKSTLNPKYNEHFKYNVEQEEIELRSLWVTVWHHRVGHNVFLGEQIVPLADIDLNDPAPQWYSLHEKRQLDLPSPHLIYKGDLSLAIKHAPANQVNVSSGKAVRFHGELQVWIKDARNLIATHTDGYSNPFVKALLLPDKAKKTKQKTGVIRNTLSPSWNVVLTFDNVAHSELPERCLEITVWDHSRFRTNSFLGGLRISLGKGVHKDQPATWMQASGSEVTLWRNVINKSSTWIEGTLPLRAHMD